MVSQVVQIWRKELSKINAKAAESLADPAQYSNLFPDLELALKAEQQQREQHKQSVPAKDFQDYEGSTLANLIEDIRGRHTSRLLQCMGSWGVGGGGFETLETHHHPFLVPVWRGVCPVSELLRV